MVRVPALLALAALAWTGCADADRFGGGGPGPDVVTTTPALADLVESIGGDAVSVRSLIPHGADPHEFVLPDIQVALVESADLVVANGAELERDLDDIVGIADHAGADVFVAAEHLVNPATDTAGSVDPHFWLDPDQMAAVARALGERLADLDPDRAARYDRASATRSGELRSLAGDMAEVLGPVPEARRGLVSHHDFLRSFARRFGFTAAASVIPDYSSQGQPSAASRLSVIETIDERGVCALFVSDAADDTLAQSVAREAERDVRIVRLAGDTMVDPDRSYDETMRDNALAVARALTECG